MVWTSGSALLDDLSMIVRIAFTLANCAESDTVLVCFHGGVVVSVANAARALRTAFESTFTAVLATCDRTLVLLSRLSPIDALERLIIDPPPHARRPASLL